MITKVRTIVIENNQYVLKEIDMLDIAITFPCILSIDGSTDNTGMAILRKSDGAIVVSMYARLKDETPVMYKTRLKRFVKELLLRNPAIKDVFYEEPFLGYGTAAANLFMLRTFLEEIQAENEPCFDYITRVEVSNQKWKKLFFAPDTSWHKADSKLQKKMIREKLIAGLPYLAPLTQDELDAIAMGFTAITKLKAGEAADLASKKKARPFKYEIQFIGAEDDEVMIQELFDVVTVPPEVLENGIALVTLNGRGIFDTKVYEAMGEDDKLVILKFSSKKYGNIILEHRIGHLAATFDYLYAVVWRKYRK